jgi:Flp pilus assembly pilin Flp
LPSTKEVGFMMERLMLLKLAVLGRVQEIREQEAGQAAVEYGVLLALILVAALVFIPGVGGAVADAFSDVSDALVS